VTREKRTDKISLPSLTLRAKRRVKLGRLKLLSLPSLTLLFAQRVKLGRLILSVLFSLVTALPDYSLFMCVDVFRQSKNSIGTERCLLPCNKVAIHHFAVSHQQFLDTQNL